MLARFQRNTYHESITYRKDNRYLPLLCGQMNERMLLVLLGMYLEASLGDLTKNNISLAVLLLWVTGAGMNKSVVKLKDAAVEGGRNTCLRPTPLPLDRVEIRFTGS